MGSRSLAEESRSFVEAAEWGVLSTTSVDPRIQGWPFGSFTPFSLDGWGRPVVLLSSLAEHRKNLEADPRASLLVVDPSGRAASRRVTIVARFGRIPEGERAAVAKAHVSRLPDATRALQLPDFAFFRGEVERVRVIAGFGEIAWIEPSQWFLAGRA